MMGTSPSNLKEISGDGNCNGDGDGDGDGDETKNFRQRRFLFKIGERQYDTIYSQGRWWIVLYCISTRSELKRK